MGTSEESLVAWLRLRFSADPRRVPVALGDDMAVVQFGPGLVAITADMLLDGVHFDTRTHSFPLIGRKAIACSLSDCAAMACRPRAATVSLALPREMPLEDIQAMYEGMDGIAREFGCDIVGGDTTSWLGKLAIDVAILAEPMAPRGPVLRSGARVGDAVYVSGPLGGSIISKHLAFEPRLELAARLAPDTDLHALMDISDGLALDLSRLCEASGCAAELDAAGLDRVISPAARTFAGQDGRSPLEHALGDGEDFELLVVGEDRLQQRCPDLLRIGRICAPGTPGAPVLTMVWPDGRCEPLAPMGYQHQI